MGRGAICLAPLLFGPGRGDAAHAGVGDELAHVFVVVDEDAEEDVFGWGVLAEELHLFLEVGGGVRGADGVEGGAEPEEDVVLTGNAAFGGWRGFRKGHLNARLFQEPVVGFHGVHEDFAGGADAGGGAPGVLFGGRGFGEGEDLGDGVVELGEPALAEVGGAVLGR